MKWNLIRSGLVAPEMNMGLDEALLQFVIDGRLGPCVRLYGWRPAAVTIGYAQEMERDVDFRACESMGIPVIRRITGGGAVFHDEEITYSIVVPIEVFGDNITESYRKISIALIGALELLGLTAEFAPVNDILVKGRKISGSAQIRRSGALLQHGTILLGMDVDKMFTLLRVAEGKLKRKSIERASDRVTSIEKELGGKVTFEAATGALASGFEKFFGCIPERFEPCEDIKDLAERLAREKFGSKDWNFSRKTGLERCAI